MRMKTSTITTSTRNDISMLQKAVSTAPKRSEEHTSELQSRLHLVCRLLLEKKNALEHSAKQLRRFDTYRAYQHRLFPDVAISAFIDHRVVFFAACFVDPIVVILPHYWPVRR